MMLALSHMTPPVLLAVGLAVTMVAATVFIIFYHDRKHDELDQWVDFAFSRERLGHALRYYRFMAVSMLVFYVWFTISCLLLQAGGHQVFAQGIEPVSAGPIGTSLFALDLVLRGGFFDIMEHFDLGATPVAMNRGTPWFVWYAFIFRMYYGVALIKILVSFVWIYGKIRMAHQKYKYGGHQGRSFGSRSVYRPAGDPAETKQHMYEQ
jgi:hypothetical protein